MDAEAGLAVIGEAQARKLAIARAARHIHGVDSLAFNLDPATGEAMRVKVYDKDGDEVGERDAVLPRDRIAASRLVLDAAGVTGPRVQVNVNTDNRTYTVNGTPMLPPEERARLSLAAEAQERPGTEA